MVYTVNKLAKIAGISARTLHYYDEIGLLKPSTVADNGYRHYTQKELERLQQILFFREIQLPLEQIKEILDSPGFNRAEALEQQKTLLTLERERIDQLIQTVDKTLSSIEKENTMKDEELYEGLSRQQIDEYTEEARQKWGNTDAFKQSQERTKHWTDADYARIKENMDTMFKAVVVNMDKGYDSPEVQAQVDTNYRGINENFYDCSIEMFRGLAELPMQDDRYAANYRKYHPDLPEFWYKAMVYYCDQRSK